MPILLGTNVLEEFLANCSDIEGDNFLQIIALFTPCYLAFRCITVGKRELKRHTNYKALVRCAESACVTIPANITVTVKGITCRELNHRPKTAMQNQTEDYVVPGDFS